MIFEERNKIVQCVCTPAHSRSLSIYPSLLVLINPGQSGITHDPSFFRLPWIRLGSGAGLGRAIGLPGHGPSEAVEQAVSVPRACRARWLVPLPC